MTKPTLYDRIYSLLGDECQCGGEVLECNDTCCPPEGSINSWTLEGRCGKKEMQELKQVVDYLICDACTEDRGYNQDHSGCRAYEGTCIDGRECPDFVTLCLCPECNRKDELVGANVSYCEWWK